MQVGTQDITQSHKPINDATGRLILDFGQFKGTPITRVPVHYLKFLCNSVQTYAEVAKNELKRRGTVTPTLEVSGHAIDRASQRCLRLWEATRNGDEGLHAWLVRQAQEALKTPLNADGSVIHGGIKFVFENGYEWPVLKTVMPYGKIKPKMDFSSMPDSAY